MTVVSRDREYRAVRDNRCPVCGAEPGQWCRNQVGGDALWRKMNPGPYDGEEMARPHAGRLPPPVGARRHGPRLKSPVSTQVVTDGADSHAGGL